MNIWVMQYKVKGYRGLVSLAMKTLGSEVGIDTFEHRFPHLLTIRCWSSHTASLSLQFSHLNNGDNNRIVRIK